MPVEMWNNLVFVQAIAFGKMKNVAMNTLAIKLLMQID